MHTSERIKSIDKLETEVSPHIAYSCILERPHNYSGLTQVMHLLPEHESSLLPICNDSLTDVLRVVSVLWF